MATSITRGSLGAARQQVEKVSRGSGNYFINEVMPSGGAVTLSMGIGTAAWTGVNFTFDSSVWPLPAQVKSGVVYGPNGNDLTGTLASGGGSGVPRSRITNA
jgi:hypothetical protein